jgi:hypothetical protein
MVCRAWPPTRFTTPSHLRPTSVSVHPQCLQTCTPAPVGSAFGNPSSCWHRQDPINHGPSRHGTGERIGSVEPWDMPKLSQYTCKSSQLTCYRCELPSETHRPQHPCPSVPGIGFPLALGHSGAFEPISFSVRVTSDFYLHWTRVTSNVHVVDGFLPAHMHVWYLSPSSEMQDTSGAFQVQLGSFRSHTDPISG